MPGPPQDRVPFSTRSKRRTPEFLHVELEIEGLHGVVRTFKVDAAIPRRWKRNHLGLALTSRGTYEYLYEERDGRWVEAAAPRGGGRWVMEDVLDDDPDIMREIHTIVEREGRHQRIVATAESEGFDSFVMAGVRVEVLLPPHQDFQTGVVTVHLRAFDHATDTPLNVGDGIFMFDGIPTTPVDEPGVDDPLRRLRQDIVGLVKSRNRAAD